jgi:hypothetical protein
VQGESVLVRHLGEWLPGTVLWEYRDTGRPRALVRFETAAGLVIRELRWRDELKAGGRVIELPLLDLRPHQKALPDDAQAGHDQPDRQDDPKG